MGTKKKTVETDFLSAKPSPLFGLARILDFGGTFDEYNGSENEAEADAKAMYADWAAVGDSLRSSMAKMDAELDEEKAA